MKFILFIHLFSLVVAYGTVIFVDIVGLLWAVGKKSKQDIIAVSNVAPYLIWLGLAALIASGILLHPNLHKPLTQLKLLLVVIIALNGINLHYVAKATQSTKIQTFLQLPKKLIIWSVVSISLSQLAWFGAMLIGFINTSSHLIIK